MAKIYRKSNDCLTRPFRHIFLPLCVLAVGYLTLPTILSLWDEIFNSLILFELVFDASRLRL